MSETSTKHTVDGVVALKRFCIVLKLHVSLDLRLSGRGSFPQKSLNARHYLAAVSKNELRPPLH